jgi:hypothetical protein
VDFVAALPAADPEAPMDTNEFIHNASAHSPEDLAPFEEKYVAWSMDGKEILAHADSLADLYREVDQKGIREYVTGFVPASDISDFGGATL